MSTADNFFKFECGIDNDAIRLGLVDTAVDMQIRVLELTVKYEKELRSYYYVTPTSYLELLENFKKLLSERQSMIKNLI